MAVSKDFKKWVSRKLKLEKEVIRLEPQLAQARANLQQWEKEPH